MENTNDLPLVIVGSGLAGTTTLIHELLKIADDPSITSERPVPITLVERFPKQLHGGIAYGTTSDCDQHRLNLSAKKVPIFPVDQVPQGFPTFPDYIQNLARDALQDPDRGQAAHDAYIDCLQNPPRALFGDYLEHVTQLALHKAGDKVKFTTRFGELTKLDVENPAVKTLTLQEDGKTNTLAASRVVLSTGFKETLQAPFSQKLLESDLYLDDNYSDKGNVFYAGVMREQAEKSDAEKKNGHALIIGTGLSANDAAIRLLTSGYQGKITMLSRNGLEHAGYGTMQSAGDYLENGLPGETRPEKVAALEQHLPRFMRIVRDAADGKATGDLEQRLLESMNLEFGALVKKRGYTPEEVLGYWERFIPQMSNVLEPSACKRLYDQYASWLTTHRIGTTPQNTKIMHEAQQSGQLEIVAGYISTREDELPVEKDGKIHVKYTPVPRVGRAENDHALQPRDFFSTNDGAPVKLQELVVDRLISGMGYRLHFHDGMGGKLRDGMPPLWDNLAKDGKIDWHRKSGEGIAVDTDFTLLDQQGKRVEGVTAVGVPVSGATMFADIPYIEKPGRSGGRLPPFQANVVGTVSAVAHMVNQLHPKLSQEHGAPPHQLPAGARIEVEPMKQLARG